MRRIAVLTGLNLLLLLLAVDTVYATPPGVRFRHIDTNGDGGTDINLVVRQLSFTPARAHVGDTIRIDVILEDMAEGYKTIPARILANGKKVAGGLFTFGAGKGDRLYKETYFWDTRGAAPGQYRIRADYFIWEDSSPFDNEMEVRQPLILVPAGEAFPDGQPAGGTATETDPRFRKSRLDS